MFNPNYRKYIYILAGGYLAYIGYRMIRDEMVDVNPKTYAIVIGVLFIVLGIGFAGFYAWQIKKEKAEEKNAPPQELIEDNADAAPSDADVEKTAEAGDPAEAAGEDDVKEGSGDAGAQDT